MIFITGDTHSNIDIKKLSNKNFKQNESLTRNDYVIVAGDFGFIWDNSEEEKWWLKWFADKKYTILFVDGNHENHELLNSYPIELWNGGKVHKITDNVIHLMRGQVFNINGKKIFTFGGATSIDKERRIEHISWWKEELPTTRELNEGIDNLEKNNWEVDYVITHCCSGNTLKVVSAFGGFTYDYEKDILNKYFDYIESKLEYKHWYFGHYHLDIGSVEGNQTVIYQKVIHVENNEDI